MGSHPSMKKLNSDIAQIALITLFSIILDRFSFLKKAHGAHGIVSQFHLGFCSWRSFLWVLLLHCTATPTLCLHTNSLDLDLCHFERVQKIIPGGVYFGLGALLCDFSDTVIAIIASSICWMTINYLIAVFFVHISKIKKRWILRIFPHLMHANPNCSHRIGIELNRKLD